MLVKEIWLYLLTGKVEKIICTDFKIADENGESAIIMKININQVYIMKLKNITHYDVKFLWLFEGFGGGPQFPESTNV